MKKRNGEPIYADDSFVEDVTIAEPLIKSLELLGIVRSLHKNATAREHEAYAHAIQVHVLLWLEIYMVALSVRR